MRITEQIEVQAPIVECYKMGIAFDRYHEILDNIKSIRQRGIPNTWHWQVEWPNGQQMEWDVEMQGMKHNNQVISWHTVRHGDLAHSGAVTFQPAGDTRTLMQLVIDFEATACLDPDEEAELERQGRQLIEKSLQRFKNMVESEKAGVEREATISS